MHARMYVSVNPRMYVRSHTYMLTYMHEFVSEHTRNPHSALRNGPRSDGNEEGSLTRDSVESKVPNLTVLGGDSIELAAGTKFLRAIK